MAGRTHLRELISVGTGEVLGWHNVTDYSPNDEDRAWAERELGDVIPRQVPVESLGRES